MLRALSCLAVLGLGTVLHSGDGRVYAEILYYVGPDGGSWHTPDSWSLGRVPASGDTVRIFDDLTVRITGDVPDVSQPGGSQLQNLTLAYARDGTVIQDSGLTSIGHLSIGRSDTYMGEYILNGGSMYIEDFYVGESGVFTQKGGVMWVFPSLNLLSSSAITTSAVYNLDGGTLQFLTVGTPFNFVLGGDPYFDFDGGALLLPGDWTFNRLVGITNSDFRAFGNPATPDALAFDLALIGTAVYTQIYAIPEPSSLALLGMATLAITVGWWRRRRAGRGLDYGKAWG